MEASSVPEVAQLQSDVFTRQQAYDAGWTPRQVRRRLTTGRWRVVAGAAVSLDGLPIGPWQLAHAAVLTWPGCVVSHHVAGVLHGFPIPCGVTGSAIVDPTRKVAAAGLVAHRLRLDPADIGRVGRLPVTTPRRTAFDLLAAIRWDHARSLWSWLSSRRQVTLTDLERAIADRAWWNGTAQLRALWSVSHTGSASAAEDVLHRLLSEADITGWQANVPIHVAGRFVAVVDVLFARQKVVVEVDGFGAHSSRQAFQRDRSRQNTLVNAGYVVLRFTWDDLVSRPSYVIQTVRKAL